MRLLLLLLLSCRSSSCPTFSSRPQMQPKRLSYLTPPCRRPRQTGTTSSPNSANQRPAFLSKRTPRMIFLPFCLFLFFTTIFFNPVSFPNSILPGFHCGLLSLLFLSYQKTCVCTCRCWKLHFWANHVLRHFTFIVLATPTLPAPL